MSYEKQVWSKYDALKPEEENIENGAVVTDSRMNHMEEGIESNDNNFTAHSVDKNNPHKVTATQVGLGNVQNFGLSTVDEAKQGDSNAKYMTPSLTQAVLSANINSIAYANSADGTDDFTTAYPNLNLLKNTRALSSTSTTTAWGILFNSSQIYDSEIKSKSGVSAMNFSFSVYVPLNAIVGGPIPVQLKGQNSQATNVGTDDFNTIISNANYVIQQSDLGKTIRASIPIQKSTNYQSFDTALANTASITIRQSSNLSGFVYSTIKLEQGSTATPWMPSATEVTATDYPKFVGFSNTVKTNKSASDYTWFPVKDSELTNKVESHINNKANPHAVTASQVGAYSKQEIDTKLSKAVMADDSGKVTIKDLVASSITLPNDTDGWVTLQNLHYKKKNGLVSFWFDFTTTASGTAVVGTFPDGFIPPNDVMFVIVNWATTTASSKVLQLTGLNSSINSGLVGILNAVGNTRYTGHFTFSV